MSLILFVIGIMMIYTLFSTYQERNENAEVSKHLEDGNGKPLMHIDVSTDEVDGKSKLNLFFKSLQNGISWDCGSSESLKDPFIFRSFMDRFKSYDDITKAMHEFGLDHCGLILGIDFTESNKWQGKVTNKGNPLHYIGHGRNHTNPYQRVIEVLGHTIQHFIARENNPQQQPHPQHLRMNGGGGDHHRHMGSVKVKYNSEHMSIPSFGFGDVVTKDHSVFPLRKDGKPCVDFIDVLGSYRDTVASVVLSGPTSFEPIIRKSIEIVERTGRYHLLVIIADGQFVDERPTARAIVDASSHPLSIVVVGVGDGPWDILQQFDDWLPQRKFDNFQFVEYAHVLKQCGGSMKNLDTALALHILMEVPDQYKICCKLGYLSRKRSKST